MKPQGKRARRRAEVLGRGSSPSFLEAVRLAAAKDEDAPREGYPWTLPAVAALGGPGGLALHPQVTYLVGENGSGKSTLIEAIAVAAGMNPEGGSSQFTFRTRDSHSVLGGALSLIRGARRPRTDFFLRAESLFTTATYLDDLDDPLSGDPLQAYGGISLHEQSHGESFLAVLMHRFGPDGLYLLDEPEAALSTQNQLTFLRRIDDLIGQGCQFIIATHSPLILAHPRAWIYELSDEREPERIEWAQTRPVTLTQRFLADRDRFLSSLLDQQPPESC